MGANKRFEVIYSQGMADITRVLLDKATGMLYLEMHDGNAGGITPLLDGEGKPMKWKPEDWA